MNKVKILNSILALILLLVVAATTTYAWYLGFVGVETNDSEKLSSEGKYYASGDGSEDNPYVITTSRHFYNLCWLQDLGYYDDKIYYFKLGANIDMSDLKKDGVQSPVPPIGIDSHPFISNFDGQGFTISNLYTTTNFNNDKYIKPSVNILKEKGENTIDSDIIKTSYVGLFGYIGSKTYNESLASMITNFTIAKAQIETTKSSLVGFICGYADNNLSKIGVAESNIKIAKDVSPIGDNAAITGKSYTSEFSLYGIVGDYSDNAGITPGSGSGSDNDWGGSIDITTLVKRIYYMAGTGYSASSSTVSTNESLNFTGSKAPAYANNKYNIYYRSNSLDASKIWNSTMGTIQYLYDGTYLPLNVDTNTSFNTEIDSSVSGLTNWKTTNYYKSNTSEYSLISNSNTGYIVGGGIPTTDGGLPTGTSAKYIYLRKEMKFESNLSNSISGSEYDADSVKIYTIDTKNGSTSTQITSSSDLQRYSTVKSNFDTIMAESKSYCYAIRFQSIKATDSSNWSDKITVKINGSEKQNYQFLKSAINFTVNKPGYITVIISSFSSTGTKMFDLFKIDRNSDNSISKVTKINKIYGDANSGTYYYDDSSVSSNILFNFENTHSLNTKSLYYFEIPVNAGDYAICKYSETEGTDTTTGYLNYLDIGANADGSSTEDTGVLKSVDYTYVDDKESNGYNLITEDIVCNIGFKLSNASTTDVYLYIFKTKADPHQVLYYFEGSGTEVSTNGDTVKKESKEELKD